MYNNKVESDPSVVRFLLFYGLSHAAVDASCAFLLLGVLDLKVLLIKYAILYNVLAFGLQAPFGAWLDRYCYPRFAAMSGLVLIAAAYWCINMPFPAVLLLGVGNALFHVGGGQISLQIKHRKAVYAGFFVAPGGIGLALGTFLALKTIPSYWAVFPLILILLTLSLLFVPIPKFEKAEPSSLKPNYWQLAIILLLLSIAIRSLIGLSAVFPWKADVGLLTALVLAIAVGKVMGGVLADRFGWSLVGVGGLLVSIPLLWFGGTIPLAGIVGMFCFNLTMPITLVAISALLPQRAGLSFGLTTAALLLGALIVFSPYKTLFTVPALTVAMILVSAAALFIAIRKI